jgi:zinc transport system substrate-binding protein
MKFGGRRRTAKMSKTWLIDPKSKIETVFLILCLAIPFLTSVSTAGPRSSGTLTVYVVNYPLAYFAERIAGEHAEVVFPAPADTDPAFWIPDTKNIMAYQKADLILLNGANYAKWIGKVSLPRSKMVDTSRTFRDKYIIMEEVLTHSHGPGGEHAHESTAFTVWIDLDLAVRQARAIMKALGRKKPDLKGPFRRNCTVLENDLMALDREIKKIVAKNPSQPLVASHPVYHYLSRRYGLNIKSVHWEPDEVPGAEQMVELKDVIKKHPAKWMIWERNPSGESLEKLESMGINSLVFDPCGNVPEKGDFLRVMRQNIENLKSAYQ